jgi:pilin isopeptide linkage protein/LPXTG-motif cell wall-anchored protein
VPTTKTYKVVEKKGTDASVTYDTKTYNITVTLEDDGKGTIKTTADPKENTYDFTNTYNTKGEITLSGKKTLENRELTEGEFSFELYEVTGEGEEAQETFKETVTNAADGSYSFTKIEYSGADLDKDAEGKYVPTTKTYKVVEKKGTDASVTYDTKTYNITVTLEDDGKGTIKTTADPAEDTYDFTNVYSASGSIRLGGVKTLIGDKTLEKGMFTFTLTEVSKPDSTGKTSAIKNGIHMETQNAKDGSFSFDQLNYTLADLGTHYYKITESAGTMKGITYDSTEYLITVTVEDIDKNGILTVTADKNLSDISFVNQYQAKGQANLYAKKTLEGKTLKDGQFIFVLKDAQGNVIQRKPNNAGGIAAFDAIAYDKAGIYQYTISEELPEGVTPDHPVKNGVTYDTSVHKVTVTVTDDGQGKLNVSYDGADTYAGAAFTNSYKAKGSITFSGDKTLRNGTLKDGQFAFEVVDSDGNVIQTVTNDANGTINFDEIRYTQDDLGTHTYTVREVEPDDDTIVCKTAAYTVKVTVKDQGDGTLLVSASDNAKDLDFLNEQKDSDDEDEDEDDDTTSSSSKTGDSNNILGYSLLALLALAGAGILFWRRRRNSGN